MNSTLWIIIFIVSLIMSVGFLLLILTLIPTLNQLKSLLVDLEKTSSEARDLASNLKEVSGKVNNDLDKIDAVLDSTKETVDVVKNSLKFVNKKVLKQSAGLLAIIPAIKLGWDFVKKLKRR
jgi:predicted PurR-regulated permease PerM